MALWQEMRAIEDPEVRRGLLQRIAKTMAAHVRRAGDAATRRPSGCSRCRQVFAERDVPFEVDESGSLPVLTAVACPYPELAEQDRGICAMERMMFSELVGTGCG